MPTVNFFPLLCSQTIKYLNEDKISAVGGIWTKESTPHGLPDSSLNHSTLVCMKAGISCEIITCDT